MNLQKIGVVLLALLLAAMAMVPMVSAAEERSEPVIYDKIMDTKEIVISRDLYNTPMTFEEFLKSNEGYYQFLEEKLGKDAALKKLTEDYNNTKMQDSSLGDASLKHQLTSTILQIQGDAVYIWPYINSQTNMNSYAGTTTEIFYDRTVSQIANELKNSGHWSQAAGLTEWGLHGDNPNYMTWSSSPGGGFNDYHLQDGNYYTTRYHLVLTEGDWEPYHSINWCYGSAHFEHWDWAGLTHHIEPPNGFNYGRDHVRDTVQDHLNWQARYTLDLHNEDGFKDAYGYLFEMG